MRVHGQDGVPAKARFLSVMLGSLSFVGMIDIAWSQSNQLRKTVKTSFGGEAKQLAAYRQLQNRQSQVDERAPTTLEEDFVDLLTEELQTLLREGRDPEAIFEFENDACESRPML